MFDKLIKFSKEYKNLSVVALIIIVALVFQILGKTTVTNWLLGTTAIISSLPIVRSMWDDLRMGKYGLDVLALTAIYASVLLGEFWAGIIIVLMLTGGQALEDYAERRAKVELTALLEKAPKKAYLLVKGQEVEVKAADLKIGDKIIVKPGDLVPADAIIIEGSTAVDEASLTGESLPIPKSLDEEILSGSINIDGTITAKVIHSAKDSQYEQIIKLVRSAAASQAPFVRLADRYSIPFTAVSYLIAGTAWFVSGDPLRFLQVIVVATPCPLLLGAPIAIISGMSRSAKYGIIIKTGTALEKLAGAQTFGFDKTGTLTMGLPRVSDVKNMAGFEKKEILAYAAQLEVGSNHILAKAIVSTVPEGDKKIKKAKDIREYPGKGLSGSIKGLQVLVGTKKFMEENSIQIPTKFATATKTQTFVVVGGKLAGVINFEDTIRPEAKATVDYLENMGAQNTLMITGDNESAAQLIAKATDIKTVYSNCLPSDKVINIEKAQPKPVAFVGDGVNDAPVLTAADVGIALGAKGSTAASESADIVIMQDDFTRVGTAYGIAKRTFSVARQSILIGIFISLGLMLIFSTGKFSATLGAGLQEVVDVIVILNALRAHTGKDSDILKV